MVALIVVVALLYWWNRRRQKPVPDWMLILWALMALLLAVNGVLSLYAGNVGTALGCLACIIVLVAMVYQVKWGHS